MPRAPKRCGRPGCTEYGRPYCPTHTTERQARANTTSRDYGWHHQQARATAIRNLIDGTPCHRCGQPLHHNQRLALDHTDDRTTYHGLTHARCNDRAGAARSAPARHPRGGRG